MRWAKHRWTVERDYLELKQELGLGHFEGDNWRGFHHHATLCIAALGFLVADMSRFSPRRAPEGSPWREAGSQPTTARGAALRPGPRYSLSPIASIRRAITAWLIRQLPCCPFCSVRRL